MKENVSGCFFLTECTYTNCGTVVAALHRGMQQ